MEHPEFLSPIKADVTLTVSYTVGFVDLGFPDKEQGMVGAQTIVGIPQYNMIVKYELKG